MRQYERALAEFKHSGPETRDWDANVEEGRYGL
jgi:hypothetical protein